MKLKITAIMATALASAILLSGCTAASSSSASGKIGDIKAPQGFVEESKKDNSITYVALKDDKVSVDVASFCGELFDWAYQNEMTRFQLVDNLFELQDYSKDGAPMGKTANENGPWVAACNANFTNIDKANKSTNKNWDKDIVFFGQNKEGVKSSAYVSAGFKGDVKYPKVTVEFKDSAKK